MPAVIPNKATKAMAKAYAEFDGKMKLLKKKAMVLVAGKIKSKESGEREKILRSLDEL